MVRINPYSGEPGLSVSVLALSSRFDGRQTFGRARREAQMFQYSLCRVVLMVYPSGGVQMDYEASFSTRSVESF